jgi:oxaloacetate decarboxylase
MNLTERRSRFQSLLRGDVCVHPGSVYDPLSARLAAELGYELGMFAGSTASLTVLGDPDDVLLTLTEFAQQAHRICRACTLPLLVDADHGYGNALNVRRTVEELETAGVSGLTIEDTELPAVFGKPGKGSLISLAEGVGKMRAALSARSDPNLAIIGRTSAITITSLDDAIARARAYEAAGADAIFLAGVTTRAQLDAAAAAIGLPLILGYPGADILDKSYLASRHVKICLQGHAPIMGAVQAVHDILKALREGALPNQLQGIASAEMMKRLTRQKDYAEWTRDFLSPHKTTEDSTK